MQPPLLSPKPRQGHQPARGHPEHCVRVCRHGRCHFHCCFETGGQAKACRDDTGSRATCQPSCVCRVVADARLRVRAVMRRFNHPVNRPLLCLQDLVDARPCREEQRGARCSLVGDHCVGCGAHHLIASLVQSMFLQRHMKQQQRRHIPAEQRLAATSYIARTCCTAHNRLMQDTMFNRVCCVMVQYCTLTQTSSRLLTKAVQSSQTSTLLG